MNKYLSFKKKTIKMHRRKVGGTVRTKKEIIRFLIEQRLKKGKRIMR